MEGTTWMADTDLGITSTSVSNSLNSGDLITTVNGIASSPITLPVADGSETKLNAGSFITITGQGTSPSPYQINSQNIYNSNGTLNSDRTVALDTKNLNFSSIATTGSSHFTVDGSTFNVDAVNNRIGIGTATPTQTLDVAGTARFNGGATISSYSGGSWINMPTSGPSGIGGGATGNNPWMAYAFQSGNWFYNSTVGDLIFKNTSGKLLFGNSNTNASMALSSDNLGLGTNIPSERLDVVGNIKFSGALLPNNTAGTSGQVLTSSGTGVVPTWTNPNNIYNQNGSIPASTTRNITFNTGSNMNFNASTLYIDGNNKRVGIGTSSPSFPLQITTAAPDVLRIENTTNATAVASASNISLINTNTTNGNYTSITSRTGTNGYASSIEFINVSHTNSSGDIRFILNNSGSYGERVRITAAGNLGIGTSNPGTKLAVPGLPVYTDNNAAAALNVGDFYRTPSGVVMVKY
jgi:hypothetical protein